MAYDNIIYTAEQLMEIEADTSMYQYHLVADTVIARLDLKAWMKARGRLRAFFTCEDGQKIIAFLCSFNNYLGFRDIPVGSRLKLTFSETEKGVFLGKVEPIPEEGT